MKSLNDVATNDHESFNVAELKVTAPRSRGHVPVIRALKFFFESRDLHATSKPTAKTHGQDCPASLLNGQLGV